MERKGGVTLDGKLMTLVGTKLKDGVVNCVEYVPEIGSHPDYNKALAAIKAPAH